MLVSIITVVYNAADTIARTIESVLNQTYNNIEYIVIDGASTDKTLDIIKSYHDIFNSRQGRTLKIISQPDNGMYDALNKGAKLVHGEIVGQINADDWYELCAVEKMVNLYKKKKYDVAWGSIIIHRPGGNIIKHAKTGVIWSTTGFCHPAMFSKRIVLIDNPYPLESMADDFDYITRIYRNGYKIVTIDEIISNYTFGGMGSKKTVKDVKKRIHNSYSIYRKYGMSRLYWFHRVFIEITKYVLG